MKLRRKVAIVAASVAILGGMTGVALAQSEGAITKGVRDTGIMLSLGGLITAIGTLVQPILKLHLDNQRLQFDVMTSVNQAQAQRQKIIDRILYDESRVDHLYRTLLPDDPPPHPPELPPELSPSSIHGL